jgi:coenzyme PQQ synthesis protein D (PqqD)
MTPESPARPSAPDAPLLCLRLRRPPQVISREVGEWLMLIDVDTGFTYEANWLGAQVWRLLAQGHSVDDACAALARAHHHSRESIEGEVVAFVRDLLGYGLASAEPASAPHVDR